MSFPKRDRGQPDPEAVKIREVPAVAPAVVSDVNARDENEDSLLMLFARQGQAEAVRWLLVHGADRNARNKSGQMGAEIGRKHAGVVRLLDHGSGE